MFEEVTHRVVQAPMAGSSTPELAVAVCHAGGLGFVALGALNAAEAGHRSGRCGRERIAFSE